MKCFLQRKVIFQRNSILLNKNIWKYKIVSFKRKVFLKVKIESKFFTSFIYTSKRAILKIKN